MTDPFAPGPTASPGPGRPLLGALVPPGPWAEVVAAVGPAGLDLVVLDSGADPPAGAVVVTSRADARTALAAGATLVLYDVVAMVGEVLGPPGDLRPAPPTLGREPVVMLPGMLGDGTVWDTVAARLGDIGQPCAARIDLDDSVGEMAATVLAEAPPRFALVGHSLGAIVALEAVRQAPERITRLALVNASGRGPSAAQQQAWAGWRERTEAGGFAGVAAELARLNLPLVRRDDAALVAAGERMAAAVGEFGFLRQLAAQSTRPDSLDRLGAIAVPVLVVSGGLDEVCPPALQAELAERLPAARHETVEGAGHLLPLEAPDALAAVLRDWLSA